MVATEARPLLGRVNKTDGPRLGVIKDETWIHLRQSRKRGVQPPPISLSVFPILFFFYFFFFFSFFLRKKARDLSLASGGVGGGLAQLPIVISINKASLPPSLRLFV